MKTASTLILATASAVSATTISLVTFDNAPGTTHTFSELNDPGKGTLTHIRNYHLTTQSNPANPCLFVLYSN